MASVTSESVSTSRSVSPLSVCSRRYRAILGGSSWDGELGEGSCVADLLLDVRTTVPAWPIVRPRTCSVPLSSLIGAELNLGASAALSQKPQLVDGTVVSSACSLGEHFSAFIASASSGGVWPVTEYRRWVTMVAMVVVVVVVDADGG
jgi:hypothetical protein